MTTTVNLKKILHRPQWEPCAAAPVVSASGNFWDSLKLDSYNINHTFMMSSATLCYLYDSVVDAYVQVAAVTIAPALAAGSCGKIHPISISRTATGGTTSTVITNITITRDLRNYKIRITGGPSALGSELAIVSNTLGTNSTITVATQGVAFTSATTYQLITPNFYVVGSGAIGASIFQRYDWALNTWTALTQTNLPATIITEAVLVSTAGIVGGSFDSSATGGYTFSAASGTTLTIGGGTPPAWTTNQWKNSQIRITGGTGAGQVRAIASNTGTVLTVATWTTNPASDSTWVLEGNDDFLYYIGGQASVAVERYSISGGTWTVLGTTGGTARAANPGGGQSGNWMAGCTDSAWTSKNVIKNGRYIYCFRGSVSAVLDILDIAGGTAATDISWAATVLAYGNQSETFTTGNCWEYDGRDNIYMTGLGSTTAPMRCYRFNIITNSLEPLANLNYPQGAVTASKKIMMIPYADGATRIDFLYHWRHTGTEVFRTIVSPFVY